MVTGQPERGRLGVEAEGQYVHVQDVLAEAGPGCAGAVAGMLMFGISTAYVFAVMQLYWPMLQAIRRH